MKKVILVALLLGLSGCSQVVSVFQRGLSQYDILEHVTSDWPVSVLYKDVVFYEDKGVHFSQYEYYSSRGIKKREDIVEMLRLFPLKYSVDHTVPIMTTITLKSYQEYIVKIIPDPPYDDGIQKIVDAILRNEFSVNDLAALIDTSKQMNESWLSPGGKDVIDHMDLLLSSASMIHKGESASSVVSKNIALEQKSAEEDERRAKEERERAEQDKKRQEQKERQDNIKRYGRDTFNRCHGEFRSFELPDIDQDGSTYTEDCLLVKPDDLSYHTKKMRWMKNNTVLISFFYDPSRDPNYFPSRDGYDTHIRLISTIAVKGIKENQLDQPFVGVAVKPVLYSDIGGGIHTPVTLKVLRFY